MTELTNSEKELVQHVTASRLRTSLTKIYEAVEDIWAEADALRIVHDYTDHGIAHSARLARFAVKLLAANYGRPFSSEEMYVLIAAIYLHDIGMQCDVLRFPAIKTRAEELGARFDTEFTALTASAYSIDEQKAIRTNHHYLAAAWIDYAYRTGDTVLGPAIKTVPGDLVADLIDVCKYHAKLPIADCPVNFRFNPTQRKRLVAALLRFADELDVDANRVSIETVSLFRLDPHNSLYWWLHNRTKVVFSAPNLILITVRLHPDDARQQGTLIHTAFIIGFQTKNQSALSILAENGMPFVISSESMVVEDDYAEQLPREIVEALTAVYQKGHLPISLADEMSIMLEIAKAASSLVSLNTDRFWDSVSNALELWRGKLGIEYVGLFAGQSDRDTILTIKASAGLLPQTSGNDFFPHFSWRKAGLREEESGDQERGHNWTSVSLADRVWLNRGFREGGSITFSSCTGLVPVRLPGGPYGVLVLGPGSGSAPLTVQEQVILDASRDLGMRILSLYLAQILKNERRDWERTFRLTGHRMRSSLQSIHSQLRVIKAVHRGEPSFTQKDGERAESELSKASNNIVEASYCAELTINTLDVRSANREFVPVGEIVFSAIADQQELADENGIEIIAEDDIHRLPIVWVNRTLMQLAFIHLINNGLKYSYPHPESHKKVLRIHSVPAERGVVKVEVVNFGLGVNATDLQRVFELGAGFGPSGGCFREVYGKGIGLWEARHIVKGHGGLIDARSVQYSGERVTDENVQGHTTVFSISLPVGDKMTSVKGDQHAGQSALGG